MEGGSLERITFQGLNGREPARNLKNALEYLKKNGYFVYGAEADGKLYGVYLS